MRNCGDHPSIATLESGNEAKQKIATIVKYCNHRKDMAIRTRENLREPQTAGRNGTRPDFGKHS